MYARGFTDESFFLSHGFHFGGGFLVKGLAAIAIRPDPRFLHMLAPLQCPICPQSRHPLFVLIWSTFGAVLHVILLQCGGGIGGYF